MVMRMGKVWEGGSSEQWSVGGSRDFPSDDSNDEDVADPLVRIEIDVNIQIDESGMKMKRCRGAVVKVKRAKVESGQAEVA